MEASLLDLAWIRGHERKVLEAVGALEQVSELLLAAAQGTCDSSYALCNQAAQAEPRSRELVAAAERLAAWAVRLVGEAKAVHSEHIVD